jgi:glycosyltransferase involved in cell wall biosynthesis
MANSGSAAEQGPIELSIVMPCLNEAETIAACIRKARHFLDANKVSGEIIVADNGSSDGSGAIAVAAGARVVPVERRGYGAAVLGGVKAARGKFVIMGDADDSYDFEHLMPFLDQLRVGTDLVVGDRFRGGIAPGAMPFLHKYIGTPMLSLICRTFFRNRLRDLNCGLRGFRRERVLELDLRTTGMEFASEMIVRASLAGYVLAEVPTTLVRDGRSRGTHLRTWPDGWRILRLLLLLSPRWLFVYPGLLLIAFGMIGAIVLLPGTVYAGSIGIDIHTFFVACISILLGLQCVSFAIIARRYATIAGFIPPSARYASALEKLTLKRVLIFALGCLLIGLAGVAWCVWCWVARDFGPLEDPFLLRVLVLSLTAIAIALQLVFAAFLSEIIEIPIRERGSP